MLKESSEALRQDLGNTQTEATKGSSSHFLDQDSEVLRGYWIFSGLQN